MTRWQPRREPSTPAELAALEERWPDAGRLWAAVMLAQDIDTCASILRGRKVMAGRLDGEALRRALRGGPLPHWDTYIEVTGEMLAALAEAGRLLPPLWEGGDR